MKMLSLFFFLLTISAAQSSPTCRDLAFELATETDRLMVSTLDVKTFVSNLGDTVYDWYGNHYKLEGRTVFIPEQYFDFMYFQSVNLQKSSKAMGDTLGTHVTKLQEVVLKMQNLAAAPSEKLSEGEVKQAIEIVKRKIWGTSADTEVAGLVGTSEGCMAKSATSDVTDGELTDGAMTILFRTEETLKTFALNINVIGTSVSRVKLENGKTVSVRVCGIKSGGFSPLK